MVACRKAREYLGADDPETKLLLGKESPEDLADAAGRGIEAGRSRGAQGAVGRRPGGDPRVEGPDDRLCPPARRQRPRDSRSATTPRSTGPLTAAQAKLADARFARLWRRATIPTRPSRCGSATARCGLDRARPEGPDRHRRSAAPTSAPPAPTRSTSPRRFAANEVEDQHGDGLRFRHHQRHHRRQFGLAGDRPRRAR